MMFWLFLLAFISMVILFYWYGGDAAVERKLTAKQKKYGLEPIEIQQVGFDDRLVQSRLLELFGLRARHPGAVSTDGSLAFRGVYKGMPATQVFNVNGIRLRNSRKNQSPRPPELCLTFILSETLLPLSVIGPAGLPKKLLDQFLGQENIFPEDEAFEKHFRISTSSAEDLRRCLTPSLRQLLLDTGNMSLELRYNFVLIMRPLTKSMYGSHNSDDLDAVVAIANELARNSPDMVAG